MPCSKPAPEQDFLTRWYEKRRRGLNTKYNYQLHQLLLAKDPEELECDRFRVDYSQVRIVHFSTERKPSTLLLDPKRPTLHEFIDEFIKRHGEPLIPDIKQYIVDAMTQWKTIFAGHGFKQYTTCRESQRVHAAPSMKRKTACRTLKLLLECGAKETQKDDEGLTAIARAKKEQRSEALAVFRDFETCGKR